jgi:hypothetical protein
VNGCVYTAKTFGGDHPLEMLGAKALFARKSRAKMPELYQTGLYRCADLFFCALLRYMQAAQYNRS